MDPFFKGRYRVDKHEWEWQGATPEAMDRHSPWATGFCVNDQSWGASRGGDLLFAVRDPGWAASEGAYGYVNIKTEADGYILGRSRALGDALWNGCFGGAYHATASPIVISGNQLFHKAVRNVVLCFEGSE